MSSQLPNLSIALFTQMESTKYAHVSAGIIVLFDHVITLEDEVELIWKGPNYMGKYLFLMSRYYIFGSAIAFILVVIRARLCHSYMNWQAWSGVVSVIIAQAILQLRTYALYRQSPFVLMGMFACCIASWAVTIWIIAIQVRTMTVDIFDIPGGPVCIAFTDHLLYTFVVPSIVFEGVLCALLLYRLLSVRKSLVGYHDECTQIVDPLLLDTFIYFICVEGIYVTCLAVWLFSPKGLFDLPLLFLAVLPAVLANRMVLQIRRTKWTNGASRDLPLRNNTYTTSPSFEFGARDTYLS